MKIYKWCWHLVGGCLFVMGFMANPARASYDSTDNRLPSPTYSSTNPVSYSTAGGQFAIDSFFDVFVDLQRFPPPLSGVPEVHSFFDVFTEIDLVPPGGVPSLQHPHADMTMLLNGLPPGTPYPLLFQTEMLQLDLGGGSLPAGVMVRESPTQASLGETRINDLGGGIYRIDSFFDVFTELSIDGGQTWVPSNGALHIVGNTPEPSSAVLALMGVVALSRLRWNRGKR